MSILHDIEKFLEDLIMGDFNEDQQVSAQIVGGLISLIPVVDQIMDVRDVSGSLYSIHKHGGFAKAGIDQKINLGFAAFGVVPEVGSAFKTVFKPLYKERKAAKGAFNGGVAMIERMLGQQKGGAVKWVKALDWAGNTQAAITLANQSLDSCIELLDYLAEGHWWCPDHLQQLARDIAPGMRKMKGQLAGPIREAATHIKAFLEDMLGEHAAAVVLAIGSNAVSLPRGGHNSAAHPNAANRSHAGSNTSTAKRTNHNAHQELQNQPIVNGKTTKGKIATAVQRTAYETYKGLNFAAKGLMGEHIADHHIIENKGWGLKWNRHDMSGGPGEKPAGWSGAPKKLNDRETPIYLCTPSSHVLTSGIDSAWLTNRVKPQQEFAIVEAKANMNPLATLHQLLGEAQDKGANATAVQGDGGIKNKNKTAGKPTVKPAKIMYMQMSHDWIKDRIKKDFTVWSTRMLFDGGVENYSRHVLLISPIQAAEHTIAIGKIMAEGLISNPATAQKYANDHAKHNVQREFNEDDLIEAEKKYKAVGKYKSPSKKKPGSKK
jgi:hypothetical protein